MSRYLISFDDGAMQFPEEDLPDVAAAAHAVMREAQAAGAWIFGGGLPHQEELLVVDTDGSVTDVPYAQNTERLGGFAIVDTATREEALTWAAKFAVACRCAQAVREFMDDPEA